MRGGESQRGKLVGGEGVDVGPMSCLDGGGGGLGGGEGERGGEEGVQLVLPQRDRQPGAQRVEEVCLAFYFCLPLTEARDWIKKVTIWASERSVGSHETLRYLSANPELSAGAL